MSRRCGSRNRRTVALGLAALFALTHRTAQAEDDANAAYGDYTYIGCFKDERDRAMGHVGSHAVVTLDGCAAPCMDAGFKYMGLEFDHECFCGDDYEKYGEVDPDDSDDDDRKCDMYLGEEPDAEAGGWWTMSVYKLPDPDTSSSVGMNSGSGSGSSHLSSTSIHGEEGAGTGGTTEVKDGGLGPVPSGARAFTVVNECSQTIRVGSTGGRITFGDGKDAESEEHCDAWGPSSVYNPGPMGQGCYWDFPPEESGNTDRMLEPGKSFRYPLYDTDSDVRWSGTIWASTGCDKIDGCLTGVCYSPTTDYICPAYVGPGGPTTKAEFTLSDTYKDYYDVSAIDGTNLPMMIEPDDPVYPPAEQSEAQHIKKYECGKPGAPVAHHAGLAGCSWEYELTVPTYIEDMRQYIRLVVPADYENPISCETDDDCVNGLICGVHPQRWANGAYKGGVEQGSCGEHIAWVSAGGACAGGWTTGEFPDAHPFYCGESVKNGMRANMYGCSGGTYAHSGYTPGAADTACGCPDWEKEYDLTCPPISPCNGINPDWVALAMPWAAHLKKACPTAYTFPYDDQTSTFTCFDGEGPGSEGYVNTQSYTITFCPGDSEKAMFG